MLPGHAQISQVAYKCQLSLEEIAHPAAITPEIEEGHTSSTAIYFNPKESVFCCLEKIDEGMGKVVSMNTQLGQGYCLLGNIMSGNVEVTDSSDEWCIPFQYDKDVYKMFAQISNDTNRLSLSAKRKMRNVPNVASTGFAVARRKILETFEANVEVVEITDHSNPAKLFELPDRPALGLRAKRNIRKNTPVLAYGGVIEQLDDGASRDGYVFDVSMPEEYEGPSISIDGKRSIGGMINDPWTPRGYPKREANLISIEHWDEETNTPQIVLYATRGIRQGEELLYHYGEEYWKVTWLTLMREHAEYAAAAALKCRRYRRQILDKTNMTGNDLEKKIIDTIHSMRSQEENQDTIQPSWRWRKSGWVNEAEESLAARKLRSGQSF